MLHTHMRRGSGELEYFHHRQLYSPDPPSGSSWGSGDKTRILRLYTISWFEVMHPATYTCSPRHARTLLASSPDLTPACLLPTLPKKGQYLSLMHGCMYLLQATNVAKYGNKARMLVHFFPSIFFFHLFVCFTFTPSPQSMSCTHSSCVLYYSYN